MLDIILRLFQNLKTRIESDSRIWVNSAARMLSELFSLRSFGPSTKYPFAPYAFELVFDFGLETFDFWLTTVSETPFQAVASTLLDYFKVPGKLRQKVLTLDQAALLVARVIVDDGVKTVRDPLPIEWKGFQLFNKIDKVENMIRRPSLKRLWSLVMGSMWTRIVRLILLVFTWGKLIGLVVLLWKWIQAVENKDKWPVIFSGALTQDNPRVGMVVRLSRRLGGVPP